MAIISSYKVKIKHFNRIFNRTIDIYRKAVAFFIDVCDMEWDSISVLKGTKRNNFIEKLTISTKKNPNPKYNFNDKFYKMPSYLRRAAIADAIGCYSSYISNLKNWENSDKSTKRPKLTLGIHHIRGNVNKEQLTLNPKKQITNEISHLFLILEFLTVNCI